MSESFEQEPVEPSAPAPRVPPHSVETEQAVLSAWSLHDRFGEAWKPEPQLFYVKAHRLIATAMSRLEPKTRDFASILAQLDADGVLAEVGGQAIVVRIIRAAPAYGDPWPHVNRLREYKALRDVLSEIAVASAEAYEHKNLGATIAKLQDAIRIGSQDLQTKVLTVADLMAAVAVEMQSKRDPGACSTGLPTMDRHTGGFQKKQVAILGAATSWGKSSFAVLVSDLALSRGRRPLIVSFEDPEELYGRRLMARRAEASPSALRSGAREPDPQQWTRVMGVVQNAEPIPFFINAIGKTVERVATDIRCVCASEKIDIVIVDYIQAIQCARKQQDRRNEVTYIARTMTDVIKSSGCAGLMFSQFKRPLKAGEKPTLHSLKETGDLENAAEMVLVGFMDSDGQRVIRTEKAKDGVRHKEYVIGWNDVTCGFTGEIEVREEPEPLKDYEARY